MGVNNIKDLENNYKNLEEDLEVVEAFLKRDCYSEEMQQMVADLKWSLLGYVSADISHEKNMKHMEKFRRIGKYNQLKPMARN